MTPIAVIKGRGVLGGVAEAPALISRRTIVGWGGVDVRSGIIVEPGHPLEGKCLKGQVLIVQGSKGSNGWSIFFHAAHVAGFGPAALVFPRLDSRTAVTAAAMNLPLLTDLERDPFELIGLGDLLRVDADHGELTVLKRAADL
jgi:predicted aconitase with swiveling domain